MAVMYVEVAEFIVIDSSITLRVPMLVEQQNSRRHQVCNVQNAAPLV
jgi:hypothetical protein